MKRFLLIYGILLNLLLIRNGHSICPKINSSIGNVTGKFILKFRVLGTIPFETIEHTLQTLKHIFVRDFKVEMPTNMDLFCPQTLQLENDPLNKRPVLKMVHLKTKLQKDESSCTLNISSEFAVFHEDEKFVIWSGISADGQCY